MLFPKIIKSLIHTITLRPLLINKFHGVRVQRGLKTQILRFFLILSLRIQSVKHRSTRPFLSQHSRFIRNHRLILHSLRLHLLLLLNPLRYSSFLLLLPINCRLVKLNIRPISLRYNTRFIRTILILLAPSLNLLLQLQRF